MLNTKIFNYQIDKIQTQTFIPEADKQEWLIGRAATCDLILETPEVSRIHGRIVYQKGQYCFSDLGSTDGSRVNQEIATANKKYVLKKDDTIRVGDYLIAVRDINTNLSLNGDRSSIATPTSNWTKEDITVKCIRMIEETEDVKTFSFVAEPSILFSYQPGQFVTLKLEIEGKPVTRAYSISSTPSRPHTLDITVKRVPAPPDVPDAPPGLVSNWLHDNLNVGDRIELIGGAMGKFTHINNPTNKKLLLISAGSGVTPMISMSRWIYDTAGEEDVVFFYCGRRRADIIMEQELQLMAAKNPNFQLAISLTKPELGRSWMGYRGRLSEQMLLSIAPDFRDRDVYVCGPDGFMKSVKTLLTDMKLPKENYHEESFGVGKKKAKAAKVTTPPKTSPSKDTAPSIPETSTPETATQTAISFVESGKTVTCDGEESILEVAQQEGVNLRGGCLQGVCGVCKARKQKGEVRYEGEPDGLDASEREQGYILPCVAYPVGEVEIVA